MTPAVIARSLCVWYLIVSVWRSASRLSGRGGLDAAARAGRLPKVKREQLVQVEAELVKGAEANGYANDVWTLQRVAEVIERVSGMQYHPARVWCILRPSWVGVGSDPRARATERSGKKRWYRDGAHWCAYILSFYGHVG